MDEVDPVEEIKSGVQHAEALLDATVKVNEEFKAALKESPAPIEEKREAVRQAMLVIGPPVWRVKEKANAVLPCQDCSDHAQSWDSALHDVVNLKTGKPLHDAANFKAVQEEFCSIRPVESAESINTSADKGGGMAFQLRTKGKELVRLYGAASVGGGVGFALVDHFGVQQISGIDQMTKDLVHTGIGVVLTLVGAGYNRLWLGELGAAYTAVPISRMTERSLLGGIPAGFAAPRTFVAAPTSLPQVPIVPSPSGLPVGYTNGRVGITGVPVSSVKTF